MDVFNSSNIRNIHEREIIFIKYKYDIFIDHVHSFIKS